MKLLHRRRHSGIFNNSCCTGRLTRRGCKHWPPETWSRPPARSPAAPRRHTTRGRCGPRRARSRRWSPSHRTEWERRGSSTAPVDQVEVSRNLFQYLCFLHFSFLTLKLNLKTNKQRRWYSPWWRHPRLHSPAVDRDSALPWPWYKLQPQCQSVWETPSAAETCERTRWFE